MDKIESHQLKEILIETKASIDTYKKMMNTGNSKGEHKEFYRGKFEAYSRNKVLLERFLRWHGIIKETESAE